MKVGPKGKKAPEKAAEKKAPEKKPKRKSRSGASPAVVAKQFLINHAEKAVLGLMGLIALLLVYKGFSQPALENSPETVRTAISSARSAVDQSTWAEQLKQRYPEPDQFDRQATEDVNAVDLTAYDVSRPLHAPMLERRGRRTDPELFAPVELEVKSGYGAVAVKPPTGVTTSTPLISSRNDPNLRPIPDSMLNQSRGRRSEGGFTSGSGEKLESRYFVAINGLIPYKKQFDAYEKAFAEADAYNFERDTPKYGRVEVERAEVQPDGKLGEWKALDTAAAFFDEPGKWSNRADELVDRTYMLNGALVTMPMPPLIRRDLSTWATHSKIPLDLTGEGGGGRAGEGRSGEGRSGEGRSGEGRGEGRGEEGEFREGREGAQAWLGSPESEKANSLEEQTEMSEGVERAKPLIQNDFALVRFFDFTVVPGKVYRYRVRLGLDDPNNPSEGLRPPNSALETDVVVRRNQAKERYRLTDWSEMSAPIGVHAGARVLASEVTQPRMAVVRGVRVETKAGDEPVAQILALTWKANGPYDVPIPAAVRRGSVLNGSQPEAEAIDPMVNQVRKIAHTYVTDTLVADIFGGQPLDSKGLTSPGYVLVMSPDGRLEMHGEIEEQAAYKQNFIPPEDVSAQGMTEGDRAEGEGREGEETGNRRGRPTRRGAGGRPARGGGERGGE